MKLTIVLLTAFILQASAKGYSQQVTFSGKDVPLEKVFSVIESQTGYVVFYNYSAIKDARTVTVNAKAMPLEQFLQNCFKEQPYKYVIEGKTIFITKKDVLSTSDKLATEGHEGPPPIDIRGRLVNENNEPVAGASVKVKGTTNGTTTNTNGEFVLTGVDENATLVFSGTNIETFEKKIGSSGDIGTLTAKIKVASLNEVVINKGYYTEKQKLSVGNVGRVTAKEIEKQPVTNPLLALQGRIPGLEVIQSSGVPGSAVKVQIRGRNSISNGNEPLYIIDGVPYTSQLMPGLGEIFGGSGALNGQMIYGNPFSFINPESIESIDVLKDADATAIYGSRAANGAILITTKKGKSGETKISLNAKTGWGQITRKIPLLNLRQYLDMRYEAYRNDGINITTLTPNNSNYDLTLWDTTRATDWQDALIGGTAKYNNVQASISGGNESAQYFIGAGYENQSTVFPGDFKDEKASVNFSLSGNSINKKFRTQLSGSYMINKNRLLNSDISSLISLAPNAPRLFGNDGKLNWEPYGSVASTWDNPLANQFKTFTNNTYNLISSASLSYELLKNLNIKSSFGFTSMTTDELKINPAISQNPNNTLIESTSTFANSSIRSWIVEPQILYTRNINRGNLEALIGSTFQSNSQQAVFMNASGFASDKLLTNLKAASTVTIGFDNDILYRYTAMFGRLKYDWLNKYIINATYRRDGSSRFGPKSRFSNFGAVGAGWIFSNEPIIANNLKFLSFGKIRASYGTNGNDQIGDYRFLSLYYPTSFAYQGNLGLTIDNLFNPALEWEETKKLELGVELGFFKGQINFTASHFRNRSSNQLSGYRLPNTTGFPNIAANQDTKVQNTGWEFVLQSSNFRSKDFTWTTSFNLTIYRNKLLEIGPNAFGLLNEWIGHSLNSNYVYHLVGVDPATGQYQFGTKNGTSGLIPDTSYFKDDLNPEYYGGLQNSISFKGVEIDFLLQFVKQIGKTNLFGFYPGSFTGASNQPVSVLNRWRSPGDDKPVQRFNQNNALFNSFSYANNSDASYGDASFIRLKNISVSYQLSEKLIKKVKLTNFRIYIQCQNLLTITKYKGSDPETRSFSSLPPLRVITTGVQLTL